MVTALAPIADMRPRWIGLAHEIGVVGDARLVDGVFRSTYHRQS